jgi:hypothetical protein
MILIKIKLKNFSYIGCYFLLKIIKLETLKLFLRNLV